MNWGEFQESTIVGLLLTIAIVGLGLYLSSLYSMLSWGFTIITVFVIISSVAMSSIFALILSKSSQQRELRNIVDHLHAITISIEKREGVVKSGLFVSVEDFLKEEAQQKEVWLVVEDFDPTGGSIWTENIRRNILAGIRYTVFLSSQRTASALGFVTKLTRKDYKRLPDKVEVNDGFIEFDRMNPQAFLFITDITIWNPYPKQNEIRRAFITIPGKDISYQVEIGDIETMILIEKLETIRNKKQ